jgi:hypothetical protein
VLLADRHEDLLRQIRRLVGVAEDRHRETVDQAGMAIVQRPQRRRIVGEGFEQPLVRL